MIKLDNITIKLHEYLVVIHTMPTVNVCNIF